mgnify:CR=1 FL=1
MNKSALSVIFLFSIFCNVEAQEKSLYTNLNDNIPEIGKEVSIFLGDQMMVQRNGEYKECFIPKTSLKISSRGERFELIANKPVCKDKKNGLFFYPNYTLMLNCRGIETVGTCPIFLGKARPVDLVEKESGYDIRIGFSSKKTEKKVKFNKKLVIKDINKENIQPETWFLHSDNSFQQTIEYVGKSGATLKFIYSEFIYGFARDAFTREFTIDLNEGNIGAYKGAVFEIIDASNSSITYKVQRHFKS